MQEYYTHIFKISKKNFYLHNDKAMLQHTHWCRSLSSFSQSECTTLAVFAWIYRIWWYENMFLSNVSPEMLKTYPQRSASMDYSDKIKYDISLHNIFISLPAICYYKILFLFSLSHSNNNNNNNIIIIRNKNASQSAERRKSDREKRCVCGNDVCERVIAL